MSARSKTPRKQLVAALLQLAEQQRDPKVLAQKIAAYLISEGRVNEIDLLARDIERLQYQATGTLEIHAVSARTLSSNVKQAIIGLFAAKNIILHEDIEQDLIGGVRVRAQDQVLDLSVRTRLRHLRQDTKI